MAEGDDGEFTVEQMRSEFVRLRDETVTQLRSAEGERDAAQARAAELEASAATAAEQLAAAQARVVELEAANAARVPGGNGQRQLADVSQLSAGEKIRLGLQQRGGG